MIERSYYLRGALALAIGAMMPGSVSAQSRDGAEAALAAAYNAEHKAWLEDAQRWQDYHEHAKQVLRKMIEQLDGESEVGRHMQEIREHRGSLSHRAEELEARADNHARHRAIHEEMRDEHHQLMETIDRLERAIEREEMRAPTPHE